MSDLTFYQQLRDSGDYEVREWAVIGPAGAIQVWCRESPFGLIGGVEYHTRTDSTGQECHLVGHCNHDGSGLQFDNIKTNIRPGLEVNNSYLQAFLTNRYCEYFNA